MTEPSKAAVAKANALVRAATPPNVLSSAKIDPATSYIDDAFARFIDHVSEVAKEVHSAACLVGYVQDLLSPLILPDPEPDVLAAAVDDAWVMLPGEWTRETFVQSVTANILDVIAKRGGRIVFDGVQP